MEIEKLIEGLKLQNNEQIEAAERCYHDILSSDPKNGDALHLLGTIEIKRQHYDEAEKLINEALLIHPNNPSYLRNRAIIYKRSGRLDLARQDLEKAILIKPDFAEAFVSLGDALAKQHQLTQAIQAYCTGIALNPNNANAFNNIGNCYLKQHQFDLAEKMYRQAIKLMNSEHSKAYSNLGVVYQLQGKYQESIPFYQRALEMDPNDKPNEFNLSLSELILEDYKNGWPHYEARISVQSPSQLHYTFQKPTWQGEDLNGKKIFVYETQGYGDMLQFLRFLPELKKRGAHIIFETKDPLHELLKDQVVADVVIPRGKILPDFDYYVYSSSLPYRLNINSSNIPYAEGYLKASPNPKLQSLIKHKPKTLNIGLVWAGNKNHVRDNDRSMDLKEFIPLLELEHTQFYSLQMQEKTEQIKKYKLESHLIDLSPDIKDFNDMATLINELDLLISVDTAAVHLAGALNKPVWNLITFAPDFRWLTHRSDTPWYQSVQLFRQKNIGNWDDVISDVKAALMKKLQETFELTTIKTNPIHLEIIEPEIAESNQLTEEGKKEQLKGNVKAAKKYYEKALKKNPHQAEALHLLGVFLAEENRLSEALKLMSQAIAEDPNAAQFYRNRSLIYQNIDQLDNAIEDAKRAILARLNWDDAYACLADCYVKDNQPYRAAEAYSTAIALNPKNFNTHNNIGNLYLGFKQYDKATEHYQAALSTNPESALALSNLGLASVNQKKIDEGIEYYKKAIQKDPAFAKAYANLGSALARQDQFDEAEHYFKRALKIDPNYSEVYAKMGFAHQLEGRFKQAIVDYQKAFKEGFSDPNTELNIALAYLTLGDFTQGWKYYEGRLKFPNRVLLEKQLKIPRWNGEDIKNKNILVYAEQGFGDNIQFSRYILELKNKGAHITLCCQESIVTLLASLSPDEIITNNESSPNADYQVAIASLPYVFKTQLNNIPYTAGYLKAIKPHPLEHKIQTKNKVNVGLVWSGNKDYVNDKKRSIPLQQWGSLLSLEKCQFYSMQYGKEAANEIESCQFQNKIINLSNEIHNFNDAAVLIEQLDLLISVDSAPAHLGGALGKPTWIFIPKIPDYRWLLDRNDSPWYQSVRLFRQTAWEDWDSVIQSMKKTLENWKK